MSTFVDQKIVEMAFHNKDFERNAKQTLKTLQELNDASNMEGAAESFSAISKATSKSLGLKPVTKQASLLSKSFSTIGKVAKTAFNGITSPIHALTNSLKTFGSYAQTVFGFNLANKLIGTGEQLIRAFTIDPLRTGWNEYELKMDSIKTIMTGSGESIDVVKVVLEELNAYADKTVYSFSDMTSSIAKFVSNGAKLDDATAAIKGISNAAAFAGQGSAEASRVMYNASQALAAGKMLAIDWKSFEYANVATPQLKQAFIDAAAALGKLEKKGDQYFTKTNKKMEVTKDNFRNTLNEGWADTDVMLLAYKLFSGELNAVELAAMGLDWDNTAQYYEDLGKKASEAAQEVRTFSKMMDSLKEAAQSGWALSYEYIIGDEEEATTFWSEFNKRFSDAINAGAKARNDLLLGWRGRRRVTNEDGTEKIEQIEGAIDGREVLIQSLRNILDTVELVSNGIRKAWKGIFGEFTSEGLINATVKFQEFTLSIKNWFGDIANSDSRVAKLSKVFEGFLSIVSMVWDSIKIVGSFIGTLIEPFASFFIDLFGAVGNVVKEFSKGNIIDVFKKLKKTVSSLTKEKASQWFIRVSTSVKTLFSNIKTNTATWLKDHGFGNILENLTSWFDQIKTFFTKTIPESDFGQAVETLWDPIAKFFTSDETLPDNRSPFLDKVIRAWDAVVKFFTETIPSSGFGEKVKSIWDPIAKFFTSDETLTDKRSPFLNKIITAWEKVLEFFTKTIPESEFAEKVKGIWDPIVKFFTSDESLPDGRSPFLDKIVTAWDAVVGFFTKTIPESNLWQTIETLWDPIVKFFTSDESLPDGRSPFLDKIVTAWDAVARFFTDNDSETGTATFGSFITSAKEAFIQKWNEFTSWASGIKEEISGWFSGEDWAKITEFFSGFGSSISYIFQSEEFKDASFTDRIQLFFQNIFSSVSGLVETIKTWDGWGDFSKKFREILEAVGKFLKIKVGDIAGDSNKPTIFETLFSSVTELVNNIKNSESVALITEFFNSIGNLFQQAKEAFGKTLVGRTVSTAFQASLDIIRHVFVVIRDLLDFFIDKSEKTIYDSNGNPTTVIKERVSLWKVLVAGIATLLGTFMSGAGSLAISTAASSLKQLSKIILYLTAFMGVLTAFSAILAIVPDDVRSTIITIATVIGVLGALTTIILAVIGAISKSKGDITKAAKGLATSFVQNFIENIANSVIKWVGILALFAVGLPPTIEALKGLDADWTQIAAIFGGVSVLILAIAAASAAFSLAKVDIGGALVFALSLFTTIVSLAMTLQFLGGLVSLWGDAKDAILTGAKFIGEIVAAFNEAAYGKELTTEELVTSLTELSEPLVGLGVVGRQLDMEGLYNLEEGLHILENIGDIKFNDASFLARLFAKELTIEETYGKIKQLFQALHEANATVENDNFDGFLMASKVLASVMKVMESLMILRQNSGIRTIGEWFSEIMTVMDEKSGWDHITDFISEFGVAVNAGLEDAANNVNANPLINAIAKAIREGQPDIQAAIAEATIGTAPQKNSFPSNSKLSEVIEQVLSGSTGWGEAIRQALFSEFQEEGQALLSQNTDWMELLNGAVESLQGPEGILGLLLGGTLFNQTMDDNASMLPFGLKPLIEGIFGKEFGDLIPEGMTLDGILSTLATGNTEKISSMLTEILGIDLSGFLNAGEIKNMTLKDVEGLFGAIEGYEGSAIQSFFASNDPNSTVIDLISKYFPADIDANSIDWDNPFATMAEYAKSELEETGLTIDSFLPESVRPFFNKETIATWIGTTPDQLDFSSLEKTISSVIPPLISSIENGINIGFGKASFTDINLFDPIWAYLHVDSSALSFSDLQKDVATIVASIVPPITNGAIEGFKIGFSSMNLFGSLFEYLGISKDSVDTTSLQTTVATVVPTIVNEIESGLMTGLGNSHFLGSILQKILSSADGASFSISPVMEGNGLFTDLLSSQNGLLSLKGTVTLDAASLDSVTGAINRQGTAIVSAVNAMANRISGVEAAIRNMKITLSTGVVAGAVSSHINRDAAITQRTSATAMREIVAVDLR